MNLNEVNINKVCEVKSVNIENEILNLRILELGIISGTKITIKHKSLLKKTLLIAFNNSCFSINENLYKNIEVEYV